MKHAAIVVLLLAAFTFVHLHRMGELSFTWDETSDLLTVGCLQRTGNAFACVDDISQTRLPFYLHAWVGTGGGPNHTPDFLLSFAFNALTLAMVFVYARRTYGALAATLFVALYVSSPAMLAAGRLLLSHSHIICTAFSTLSFLAMLEHSRTQRRVWLMVCAIATGAAAASSVLAIFNAIVLLAFYKRPAWRDWIFLPIAATTFFAATVIYVKPSLFAALVDACLHGGEYPFWNYLGLGTSRAPWFFPFLLLAIKVGPWLLGLRSEGKRFAIALLIVLLLKGVVFGYDTPHHQVQFYPLLFLFIAAGIARMGRPVIAAIAMVLFAVQIYYVVRFFPNYLFHGAQYGERFIGEFYGPAVMHGQGRNGVWDAIDSLPPDTTFLMADHNAFERTEPRYVPFTKRDPNTLYDYALVDRLHARHFTFPERDAYNRYLEQNCRPYYTSYFPPRIWMYRVMRCETPATP